MSELKDVSGGEWGVNGPHLVCVDKEGETWSAELVIAEGWLVACTYGRTPEEALANAKLVAAAKELAEALNNLLGYFRSGNECPVDRVVIRGNCEEVVAGLAALKKAGAA